MNKRLVWFTELFIWAFVIIALTLGFTYSFATSEQKNHSYYMFFKDVDGLTQGSPVRMMGYKIGYVRDVKVFKDNIFVSFLVTEKDVIIPNGSVARVEFYGLGGSKSLEIEPASSSGEDNGEMILTQNPYRISDYYRWGKQIDTIIESTATNTSTMLDAFNKSNINISFLTKSAQKFNNMVQSFVKNDNVIDSLNEKIQKFNKKHKDIGHLEEQPVPKEKTNDTDNIE